MVNKTNQRTGVAGAIFLTFVFWFGSNLGQWVFSEGGPPPVFSYIAFLAFASFAIGVPTALNRRFPGAIHTKPSSAMYIWLYVFSGWSIFAYLYSSQTPIVTDTLVNNLEMVMIMGVCVFFMAQDALRSRLATVFALIAIFGAIVNLYDFMIPTFSTVPGRAAGLYLNPNLAGFVLTLAMTAAMPFLSRRLRWITLLIVAAGVLVTFSRAAWLVLFGSVVWLSVTGYLGFHKMRLVWGLLVMSAVAFLAYGIISGDLLQLIDGTPVEEYLTANTLNRLGNAAFATDFAANERNAVVRFALSEIETGNVFVGAGLGYTQEWMFPVGTHNMYLMFIVEGGVICLAIYMSLLGVLWRRAKYLGLLVLAQLIVAGIFSHNLLDSPAFVIFIAALGAGVVSERGIRAQQERLGRQ